MPGGLAITPGMPVSMLAIASVTRRGQAHDPAVPPLFSCAASNVRLRLANAPGGGASAVRFMADTAAPIALSLAVEIGLDSPQQTRTGTLGTATRM
ncbi:hypothetical protein BC828DRAFT_205406 [Blastocladiella britannica]|nr:hypothetical protein BC828DRAFT_205406 [Blastocladiella britannica]